MLKYCANLRVKEKTKIAGIKLEIIIEKFSIPDMYREIVTRRAEAYCHLFFHCCMGDESLVRKETAFTVAKYVESGLNASSDLADELDRYRVYRPYIQDESDFLSHLVKIINPASPITLYFYCIEIILADNKYAENAVALLKRIAAALKLSSNEQFNAMRMIREVKSTEAA